MADWHPDIRIVLAGGEPFLRREMVYGVAEAAAERGVYTTFSTNGALIRDADLERLPLLGVRCVVVSLDSEQPEVYDRIRGVPDTFKRATRAIRQLVEARDRARADFSVLTSTILGSHNLDRVDAMVNCFESLGVNTTVFQPLQPASAREMMLRWWATDPLFPRDTFQIDRGIDQLTAARSAGRRVFQFEAGLEDIRYYLKKLRSLLPGQCASMERHIMVDSLGDVRLCFNMERMEWS